MLSKNTFATITKTNIFSSIKNAHGKPLISAFAVGVSLKTQNKKNYMDNVCKSNFWTLGGRMFATRKKAIQHFRSLPPIARYKILSLDPTKKMIKYGVCATWYKCDLLHIVDGRTTERKVIRFNSLGELLTIVRNEKK